MVAAAVGGRMRRGVGKYNVAPAEERTHDGIVFDSKRELREWLNFNILERTGLVTELRRQVKFDLHCFTDVSQSPVKVSTYIADMVCLDNNGNLCVYDVKGVKTAMYRLKKKWVEAEYGVRIVEL